jgi:hypothetical protein
VRKILSLVLLFLLCTTGLFAYKILYAEQFYRLYHLHFYQYPDDTMENIYYLERALKSDFANPLYALAEIENEEQWAQYRTLFKMHVNLKLVDLYLTLGSKYDKMIAYFYNAPWRDQNLESLDKAEQAYRVALEYWREARSWAAGMPWLYYNLREIQNWEDERARIWSGDLDYGQIIAAHLARLQRVRETFLNMDENTY